MPLTSKACTAVIFDLDGLVLDTEITYFDAWQQALTLMGLPFYPEWRHTLSGMAYKMIEQQLLQAYGASFDLARFGQLSAQCWRASVQRDGIAVKLGFHALKAWLDEQQIPYALATNSPGANARECLALAGLTDAFAIMVSREQVKQPKPHPDVFLQAAACLAQAISQCLVLEDSYTGITAAASAGAKIVYIPSSQPDVQAQALAHWQFDDLQQLLQNLQQECSL